MSEGEAMPLFPEPADIPPQAARLAPKLHALAERGIYFGTSSWKYEGWLGSIYSPGALPDAGQVLQDEVRGELSGRIRRGLPGGLRRLLVLPVPHAGVLGSSL